MVLAFLAVIPHFKPPVYLHEIWNALACQRGSQRSLPLVPSGETHQARSWGHSDLLAWFDTVCPWWARGALSSQPLWVQLWASCRKHNKSGIDATCSQSRPLGQDQRACLSASLLPDRTLSSTLPSGTGIMSATEVQGEKVRYVRCERTQKNGVGSYEMGMNFSGHFIGDSVDNCFI